MQRLGLVMMLLVAGVSGCLGDDAPADKTPATTNDLAAAPAQPLPPQLLVQAHSDHLRLLAADHGTETYSAEGGQAVLLDAAASHDPAGGDLDFAWYHNGAMVAEGPLWAYAFHHAGNHIVALQATTDAGARAVHSMMFKVAERPATDPAERTFGFDGRYTGGCTEAAGEHACAGEAHEYRFTVAPGARELRVLLRDDDRTASFNARLYAPDGALASHLGGGELTVEMASAQTMVPVPPNDGPLDGGQRERAMVIKGALQPGIWTLQLYAEDSAAVVAYEATATYA